MTSFRIEEARRLTTDEERERSFLITDPRQHENPIVFANDAFVRLTGYRRDEVVGRNCRFLQGADTDSEAAKKLHEAIEKAQSIKITILNYKKSGQPFWNNLNIRPVFDDEGVLRSFVGVQNPVPGPD